MFIFTKSLLFCPVDYVPHTGRRFTVSYEMTTNVTCQPRKDKDLWLDLFSSSAVQMENHRGQFEPKKGHPLFGLGRIYCQGLLPTGNEQGRVESQIGDELRKIIPQSVSRDNGRLLQ